MTMTYKEVAKVTHDINNIWHIRYNGQVECVIETSSDKLDSPTYSYHFINHGFDDYEFVAKMSTRNGR